MGPEPPVQLRCIGLDPSKDGGVRDVDTALLQHEFEVAIADWEHQIPAYGLKNHLGGELPLFEGQIRSEFRQSSPCHAPAWPRSRQAAKDATEPASLTIWDRTPTPTYSKSPHRATHATSRWRHATPRDKQASQHGGRATLACRPIRRPGQPRGSAHVCLCPMPRPPASGL
jgi:hypothetical protein